MIRYYTQVRESMVILPRITKITTAASPDLTRIGLFLVHRPRGESVMQSCRGSNFKVQSPSCSLGLTLAVTDVSFTRIIINCL